MSLLRASQFSEAYTRIRDVPTTDPAQTLRETTPSEDPAARIRVGRTVGAYRLCLEIGSGGMATVFLASRTTREGEKHYVALKCMRPLLMSEDEFVGMFEDEARIAARVQHPNVCPVIDWGVADGVYYLALPYLEGETLRSVRERIAERGELVDPVRHACLVARIVADAAEGLHAAHELRDASGRPLDVVHRDVSPENVFVTYHGNVSIVDFGLVRARGQVHHTRTGIVKGKFAYLQPEVIQGQPPDRRADVWSLGVVLWELLTRQRLFRRETDAATLQAITTGTIAPPSEIAAGIPPAMDAIVMRALDRDPAHRFATTRELGRELLRFLGARGCALGLPDIADMMATLFPGGPACARQRLMLAEQVEEASRALEIRRLPEAIDDDPWKSPPRRQPRQNAFGAWPWRRARWALGIAGLGAVLYAIGTFAGTGRVSVAPTPTHLEPLRESAAAPPPTPSAIPLTDSALAIEVGEATAGPSGEIRLELRVVPAQEPVPPRLQP